VVALAVPLTALRPGKILVFLLGPSGHGEHPEMNPKDYELVEPADLSPRDVAVDEMSRCSTPEIASWLIDAILSLGQCSELPEPDEARLLWHLECIRTAVVKEAFARFSGDPDAALLRVLIRLPGFWVMYASEPVRVGDAEITIGRVDVDLYSRILRRLLPTWRQRLGHHDWSRTLSRIWTEDSGVSQIPEYNDAALDILLEDGMVRPADMMDVARLREFDRYQSSWSPPGTPDRLEFWTERLGAGALHFAFELLERAPPSEMADLALGILGVSRFQLGIEGQLLDPGERKQYARVMRTYVEFLGDRLEEHRDELPYLGAYWWAVLNVSAVDHDSLGPKEAARAAASAKEALGRLRHVAREAESDPETGPIRDFTEHYGRAPFVIARCEGIWPAMKCLLLLLRALTVPAVASDLRTRAEEGLPPPPPRWSWVAENLLMLVHELARREQRADPGLVELRTELVRFCLDRLRTRDRNAVEGNIGNEDMIETNPAWRMCCIRAVRELRANPRRRGHHVLHWSFHNDPDEAVRHAAKTAYGEMTKGSRLPEDMSPRRPIFAALWWLRQAHLLALGVPIDKQGARRTRQVETRRTQMEDQLKS